MKLFSTRHLIAIISVLTFSSLFFAAVVQSECIYIKAFQEETRVESAIARLNREGHKLQPSLLDKFMAEGKILWNIIQTLRMCKGPLQTEASALELRIMSHNKDVEINEQWGRDLQMRFDECRKNAGYADDCNDSALKAEIAHYINSVDEINERKAAIDREYDDLAKRITSESEENNKRFIDFATKVESAFIEYEKVRKAGIPIF